MKAIGSMIGAPLAAVLAARFGDWKLLFLVFGIVSILSVIWLGSVKIDEAKQAEVKATFASSFRLLGSGFVLLMVLSIFIVVGIDVGFNSNSGQFLSKQFGIDQTAAESGRSVYFFGRMLGYLCRCIIAYKDNIKKILYVDIRTWNIMLDSYSGDTFPGYCMGTCFPYRTCSC